MILGFITHVVHWLEIHPLGGVLLLVLHLILLAAVARLCASLVARTDISRTHGVWVAAVIVCLAILPLHVFGLGLPILITVAPSQGVTQPIQARFEDDHGQEILESPLLFNERAPSGSTGSSHVALDSDQDPAREPLIEDARKLDELSSTGGKDPGFQQEAELLDAIAVAVSEDPKRKTLDAVNLRRVLLVIYFIGVLYCVLRLIYGLVRLRLLVRRSQWSLPNTRTEADRIAVLIGLRRGFETRISDEISIPMVCGVRRAVVLLPAAFDSWTQQEKQATLIHELTHLRRQDLMFLYISAINRAVYWFHPASWIFERHLNESREWATDRDVIDQAKRVGMTAKEYASCLLSVIARNSETSQNKSFAMCPAVGMSTVGEIEKRLKLILDARPGRYRGVWLARMAIAIVLSLAAISGVRLQVALAQEPDKAKATSNVVEESQGEDLSGTLATKVSPGDEDLWVKIRDASCVKDVLRETASAILDVSGNVIGEDGTPVADAVVLLRESSTIRVSQLTPHIYSSEKEIYFQKVCEVLAKTKTDSNGKFVFRDVLAPAMEQNWSSRKFRGDLVAAHPTRGVGYLHLPSQQEKAQQHGGLKVSLADTVEIEGRYVSPNQNPIAGAIVSLTRLAKSSQQSYPSDDDMDLHGSEITPRTITNSEGHFRFSNVPPSLVASCWIYDPKHTTSAAAIKTSNDVSTDNITSSWLKDVEIQASPAKVLADPVLIVRVRAVDEGSAPIQGVKVLMGGRAVYALTGEDGVADLRVPTRSLARYQRRESQGEENPITISVLNAPERNFLGGRTQTSLDAIQSGEPVPVTLKEGVEVSGIVRDDTGSGVQGINVKVASSSSTAASGVSDDEGRFKLNVPREKLQLIFYTDQEGFQLPTRREIYRIEGDTDGYITRTVDLTDGKPIQLNPVTVPRSKTVQVIVSLPDGTPAVDTNVIIKDEQIRKGGFMEGRPEVVERSSPAATNAIGRAEIRTRGVASDKAWVDFSLVQSGTAYKATAKLSEVTDGILSVVLTEAPTLEGRVLIDGVGVFGAKVSVGESREVRRKTPMGVMTSYMSSNHQTLTTDEEGFYRMPIAKDKSYSVSMRSVPGEEGFRPAIGYTAQSSGSAKVSVRDFHFRRADGVIAGTVIDEQGVPLSEASVSIMRERDVQPSFWIGHHENSQSNTDADGRFELRHVPPGNYRIRVSEKRSQDRSKRPATTMMQASSGDLDLEIRLAGTNSSKPLPRLKPIRIEKISANP